MTTELNVLLLTIDSLRYDYIYDDTVETPTFDSLRDHGTDFTRAYSSAPYTGDSVPAMVSGVSPWVYGSYNQLAPDQPYLTEPFSNAGYRTGGFHSNPYLGSEFGYAQGFDRFFDGREANTRLERLRRVVNSLSHDTVFYRFLKWVYKQWEETSGIELATPYVDAADLNNYVYDWLEEGTTPGMCWVHYMDVHHPYIPHEKTASRGIEKKSAVRLRQYLINTPEKLDEQDLETLRTLYRGEIEYLDRQIGKLLERVDEAWGLDDTVVLLTSDHGEAFGEHGSYGHSHILYDETTRIPFIVDAPERDPSTEDHPVSGIDVFPTLLKAANVSYERKLEGRSVFETSEDERVVFTHAGDPDDGKIMIFDGTWKLILHLDDESSRLYNLINDPGETVNKSAEVPGVRSKLRKKVDDHLAETGKTEAAAPAEASPEVKERLRELGYDE